MDTDDTAHDGGTEIADKSVFPIIGIGASAGGIDALTRFFPAVQPDAGLAFVVVQHLAPDHSSILAELIARASPMPVMQIEHDTKVEPDHVYVIPPNATLTIKEGSLRLSRPAAALEHSMPVDRFFESLASDQGENAACVILSGTGSDGTHGLRAIKEHGGLAVAQTSASAEYDGMMISAIRTGLVDLVLPVEEIPGQLSAYFARRSRMNRNHEDRLAGPRAAELMSQIYPLLAARTGHNFSGYKDKTVIRRVQRRMQMLQIDEVATFIDRLREEPAQLDLLCQDLLIGVTNFFRDSAAFEALDRQVIPKLMSRKGANECIRVWIPACSTGEEAYSIGILLMERLRQERDPPRLQIFATDINESALETARIGRYAAVIGKDMPPQLFERYFVREDGTYRVTSNLREICLFSVHNLLRDPPFSRLDMISCRNLMIYLNADLQKRVIPLFHYALLPDAYLFLGTSENVAAHSRLFTTIDKTHRIFQRLPQLERKPIEFPLAPTEFRQIGGDPGRKPHSDSSIVALAERQILERYAPAFAIINADGDVLQSSGRTGRYLELPPGAPDTNIFGLARRGLRLELRAAVRKAVSSGQVAVQNRVGIDTDGGGLSIRLSVQPLRVAPSVDGLYLVVFEDLGRSEVAGEAADPAPDTDGAAHLMEAELRATKERLQTITEELESSNEELKSANEELSSINEELQSSNEELETSKEELQSTNEELHTVNAELSNRVNELSRTNDDIRNLLENTQIATVFLDRDFTVKSFTPAARDVFRLVESDAGRPITHIRARFDSDGLQDDLEKVLRTLGTIERFIQCGDSGSFYALRVLPYRTVNDVIGGVVLTFTDITRITAAETKIASLTIDLRNRLESLETLLNMLPTGVVITERDGAETMRVNRYAARLLDLPESGLSAEQVAAAFRRFDTRTEGPPTDHPLQRAARSGAPVLDVAGPLVRADGSEVEVMVSAAPLFDKDGGSRGAVAAIVDISRLKHSENVRETLIAELNHRVKNTLASVQAMAHRSLTGVSDAGALRKFESRLVALGKTHDLLTRHHWQGASLHDLVMQELQSFQPADEARYQVSGPPVDLRPKAVLALGLALHELATNAAQFGALSRPEGRVSVIWALDQAVEPPRLRFEWRESGGPTVTAPAYKGFGLVVIERGLSLELDGEVELIFQSEGVICKIAIPLIGGSRTHHGVA